MTLQFPSPLQAEAYAVRVVRTLEELSQVFVVRALVYMGDQICPYQEEFDGNDICGATHLLLTFRDEPVGVVRMRWFGGFAKMERLALRKEHRGGPALLILCRAAFDLAARKGFPKLMGHAQVRGQPFWKRYFNGRRMEGRPNFQFSQYDYMEMEFDLEPHPQAITLLTPPMVVLRPEGDWDRPGILEATAGIVTNSLQEMAA